MKVHVSGSCIGALLPEEANVLVLRRPRYWPGDIVVAGWPESGLRVQRVIGAYGKGGSWRMITQADAAIRPDRAVSRSQVIGRVIGGDCHPDAARVPWRHRAWAFGRFLRFALTRRSA